jgi:hypothetical protein
MEMTVSKKAARRIEFGDFQTPPALALDICRLIKSLGVRPKSVLEPTCGLGSFLRAALEVFPGASRVLGFEINPEYSKAARSIIATVDTTAAAEVHERDFFATDWEEVVRALPKPVLIVGNPPWVTNSGLGILNGSNLPEKTNVDGLPGIHALTGGSNFDISEWMLRRCIECIAEPAGAMVFLCKTSVARKVMAYVWQREISVKNASIYRIDAQKHFGAAVDACLLMVETGQPASKRECRDFASLTSKLPTRSFGFRDNRLVADVALHERWGFLRGDTPGGWRSGVKHDCSKVFELKKVGSNYTNGFGEAVDIESSVVYPLMKSSDLASTRRSRRWIVVPQRTIADDPDRLKHDAPKAWAYLDKYSHYLDKRASSIYKNRPRFCVFGIGEYSYAAWKVAISGLYKRLEFNFVGPVEKTPVFFDDTCYFYSCASQKECELLHEMLASEPAIGFLSSFIFWDSKRPITAGLLNSLDLFKLGRELSVSSPVLRELADKQVVGYDSNVQQSLLFREPKMKYNVRASARRTDRP